MTCPEQHGTGGCWSLASREQTVPRRPCGLHPGVGSREALTLDSVCGGDLGPFHRAPSAGAAQSASRVSLRTLCPDHGRQSAAPPVPAHLRRRSWEALGALALPPRAQTLQTSVFLAQLQCPGCDTHGGAPGSGWGAPTRVRLSRARRPHPHQCPVMSNCETSLNTALLSVPLTGSRLRRLLV